MTQPKFQIGQKVWISSSGNPAWRLIQGVFVDMPRGDYVYFLVTEPTRMPNCKKKFDKVLKSEWLWKENDISATRENVPLDKGNFRFKDLTQTPL